MRARSSFVFITLTDWTPHADEGIKYYSGQAAMFRIIEKALT